MNRNTFRTPSWFSSTLGAGLTILCGLVLWNAPLGEAWVNASYDYLFRFGSRPVTNNVELILMDNEAFDHFRQVRGQPWDRGLHAKLLRRLAADGAELVVLDTFFREPREPATDQELADAIRQQRRVVLMAEQKSVTHPELQGAQALLPCEPFFSAAGESWGIAWLDPDLDLIVRRHWPSPSPGPYPSLFWSAARLAGAHLDEKPVERNLRYFGANEPWIKLSYRYALEQPANYFRDKIVFIGTQPKTSVPDNEPDEFRTPLTRWTGETMGGVEILATAFLNLMNGDALLRLPQWLEAILVVVTGTLLGGGLCRVRILPAGLLAVGFSVLSALAAVSLSHFTNHWFPWLVITGGQVPCALIWSAAAERILHPRSTLAPSSNGASGAQTGYQVPETPDYILLDPPFGQGAYGKVWLARNTNGQWQALKAIYLSSFGDDLGPYEREFNGITRYKPISDQHPGLLRVDYVSQQKPAGYFFYVMELGDPLHAGWEHEPSTYRPRDLVSERSKARGQKLPVKECIGIGLALADALEFLHRQGLTHRDIKPQNIIFVNGRPKLADMGLISEIRPPEQKRTYVGTPGYMPPPPEMPGTPQADIYALGMMLYVLSTGRNPTFFPELSTTLADSTALPDFIHLNTIILRACDPDCTRRYTTASEMHGALLNVQKALERKS